MRVHWSLYNIMYITRKSYRVLSFDFIIYFNFFKRRYFTKRLYEALEINIFFKIFNINIFSGKGFITGNLN